MRSALGGPFTALRGLASSLLGSGHTRLQLLGNEIHTEKLRILRQLGFAAALIFSAGLAVLMLVALAVVLWWDQRVALLSVLVVLFAALAGLCFSALRRAGEGSDNMFAASLSELQEDLRQLRAAAAAPAAAPTSVPVHEKKPG